LAAVGEVTSVAVAADGTLVVALPATAVAMAAKSGDGIQGDSDGTVHHICTDKNPISDAEGGPWTPLFEGIFNKAGMSLKNDPANRIRIRGHEGPHPKTYHQAVFDRVQDATSGCRGLKQCQQALVEELRRIATDLVTPGSKLRKLLTDQ
ncbi:AHH domain-containing protein, partial [Pyxidicoccus sp. 3LFB2]